MLEDFRILDVMAGGKKHHTTLWNQDMGYAGELEFFACTDPAVAVEMYRSAVTTTRTTFAAMESLATGKSVLIGEKRR
jgi:hypothetical protein